MKGFDRKFADFPSYIIDITKEIWEDRGVGARMKDYYHPQVVVRTPAGISFGETGMTVATLATINEFPDRQLLAEDVIWSGDPDTGMLSSHRIYSTATHAGSGAFGPASSARIGSRAIADCYARDNMISDEWLIRDNGAVVRQIGQDPQAWTRALIEREGGPDRASRPLCPETDRDGPYLGRGNDNEWGARLADILTRMMQAEFSVIGGEYDRACHLEYAGGVTGHGRDAADRFWLPLRAAFPSAMFAIHHQIGREDTLMPPRAAVRWSLTGCHDGWGGFGEPSGADVHVMGATHAEFGPWGLRREYTLFDETAVWKQILLHQG
ncbi:MAG: ester cyclase [Rhodobacter sp.]|nr:ester cyclase [Rhodobacter sp.]